MGIKREQIKKAILSNPEGHEKLTGRYYLTNQGIQFVNGNQPKPVGALRIPSLGDEGPAGDTQLSDEQLAESLTDLFLNTIDD